MISVADLWLPILVSSVVVFFLAMLAWTVSPHHKPDVKPLGRGVEDKVMDLVKSSNIKPGMYMFPHCGGGEKGYHKSEEYQAKWKGGCIGNLNVYPGVPSMGRNMAFSFIANILTSVFVAYLAGLALNTATEGMMVMRFTGVAAVGFYGLGGLMGAIWFGASTRSFITNAVDAIVYGVATGAVFMFLWPSVEAAAGGVIPTP
jgi:hypothetical protein